MFENEDMILPDDFQEDTTPEEVTDTLDTPVETEEDTKPTETTEEPVSPFLKVKYNHEEMELDEITARELAQKGLNYDKVTERLQQLESDPRLAFIEDLANQYEMTPDQYMAEVKKQREQDELDALIQNNIPPELAQEVLEGRKDRQERKKQQEETEKKQKQDAESFEFFDYFRQVNGRDFDSNKDQIPDTVWQATQNGVPLKYAYMEHQNQQLQKQIQTHKQNETNANRAPVGSTTAHGGTEIASEDDFLAGFNSY
ncbi:hypothetical protein V7150_16080 [Neobacillus drentensis]|uniref:hypothetical protein n=1 Tax=Neobacillus drentensis TaxID=220684 RepID=UPI003000DE4C